MKFRSTLKSAAKKMSNQKGFTLIELLAVTALIAVVVAIYFSPLGNSFSGATTTNAATKIANDMRNINDAAQKYAMEKSANASSFANLQTPAQSGTPYLTTIPVAPAVLGNQAYNVDSSTYTTTWGTAAADTVATLTIPTANAQVCQAVNYQYAGAASLSAPIPAAIDSTHDIQCFGAGPYTVVKTLYVN